MGTIELGISTCPNDTFAFAGILQGAVDCEGLDLNIRLCDIRELNSLLRDQQLDVGKASFHAALHLSDLYGVLRSGSAIGQGVGPLLLAARGHSELTVQSKALCPGEWTTATLLLRILFPEIQQIEHVIFSEIMPGLEKGEAEFGVVIHEGRFTYQERGLSLLADLGELWEERFHPYLPLGGILARLDIPDETLCTLNRVVRRSIEYGYKHRDRALEVMKSYATELDEAVIWEHVRLYVNEMTIDLGEIGVAALEALTRAAEKEAGMSTSGLQLVGSVGER
jgi:1,4-dihydroxy-6-naphthoate synthase